MFQAMSFRHFTGRALTSHRGGARQTDQAMMTAMSPNAKKFLQNTLHGYPSQFSNVLG